MTRFLSTLLLLVSTLTFTFAGEGMWLPFLLQQLNEKEMQDMGMKMSAEDIYSVNAGSLKDAIVHFGGFCTGEIISDQGLILTNHHCGYGNIQALSTLENNYLIDGFWANSFAEELHSEGLFVTFIVSMKDATEAMMKGLNDDLNDTERQRILDENEVALKKSIKKEDYQQVEIRSIYHGNQYIAIVTERYDDVRLVGTPPNSIGKFGADTDNWVWPRHTGDFSMFRVYAGPDNKPAAYSPDNKPFKPRHSLPISLDGVNQDDFTLVFGFPGRTRSYLPGVAVAQQVNVINPVRVSVRDVSLARMDAAMKADPQTRLQYASKQSRIANAWKKWIGETQGVERTGGLAKKAELEAEFNKRLVGNPSWTKKYGDILPTYARLHEKIEPLAVARAYAVEVGRVNSEVLRMAYTLSRYVDLYKSSPNDFEKRQSRLEDYLAGYFKDYNAVLDEQIFGDLMDLYFEKVNYKYQDQYLVDQYTFAGKKGSDLAKTVFGKSALVKPDVLLKALKTSPEAFVKQVEGDYAYMIATNLHNFSSGKIYQPYNDINSQINALQQRYMAALMEVFPERTFSPDANGTLRVTYGQVKGYTPRDAVEYTPVTYLDGVMEKYVPGDYEFDVPEKLVQLYQKKDYGQYTDTNGQVPVCFIGTNHTSGGNSGSPAVDAYGNLVGLNFDRAWDGVMSDMHYDPSICRNIMVDIRYVLFLTEKLGGATRLIDEMKLVRPKRG